MCQFNRTKIYRAIIFTTKVNAFRTWLTFDATEETITRKWCLCCLILFLKQSHTMYTNTHTRRITHSYIRLWQVCLLSKTWSFNWFSQNLCKICNLFGVILGMAGFFAVAGYGLYNFRNRNVSASQYLMQLRVVAQGTVVGTLCLGLIYTMFNKYYLKKQPGAKTNASHQH